MTATQLNDVWRILETARPVASELSVHPSGITSAGLDVCLGWDDQARRHLLVPLAPGVPSAPSFKSAGLSVWTRPLVKNGRQNAFLDLVCVSSDLNEVFSHLVFDVLQPMQPDEPAAADICLRVLESWKELFGSVSAAMGPEQVAGLLGELLVLQGLTRVSPSALDAWDGPFGGIHDFRCGSKAIEVKTTTRRHGRYFSISGHQQLQPPAGGELHMAAIKLEPNPGGHLSLPTLLEDIRRSGVSPSRLRQCLQQIGYVEGRREAADGLRFDLSEYCFFRVADDFPRIVAASFSMGSLPPGVIRMSYEIDLSGPAPAPLPGTAADLMLRKFAFGGAA